MVADKRTQARLFKEVVALVVVLGLLGVFYFINQGGKNTQSTQEAKPLETKFETGALEEIKEKPADYPEIDASGVGKRNPFGG